MTKNEFLGELKKALSKLKREEREKSVAYYRELLEDRVEEGLSEEAAVEQMEQISVIAERILGDAQERDALKPARSPWAIVLLVIGSPLWIPILALIAALLLSMYAIAWAVILICFAVLAVLAVGGISGCILFIPLLGQNVHTAFVVLGAGFVLIALVLFLCLPVWTLAKWMVRATSRTGAKIWRKIFRKGGEMK